MHVSKAKHLLCLTGIALLLMTVGSMTSFLFPLHTGVDQNCFLTVARAWLEGRLPYRDIFEQKGPLLYLLHIPAAAFPQGRFFGVYLVQTAVWVLLLLGFERLARICMPGSTVRTQLAVAAWSALAIVTARCYSRGDNAEEFCLVPVVFALCDLMQAVRAEQTAFSRRILLRNGIFAGLVLWIKFSMLGFFIGWCLVIGVLLWRDRGFLTALRAGLWFLLGMALTAVPVLLYFGLHHALRDLFDVYFLANATLYPRKITMLDRVLDFFRSDLYKNPVMVPLILFGAAFCTKGRRLREKAAVWVPLSLLYVFVFIGGVRYRYYLLILGAFVPFGIIALRQILQNFVFSKHESAWFAVRLCMYPSILVLTGNCLYFIGKPRSYYPQVQFAEKMEAGKILLNYNFLDGGFFLMSGTKLPDSRYFCKVNIYREQLPEMFEEQERIICERSADYAVIRREKAETWEEKYSYAPFYENYEKIADAEEHYDGYCYELYQRKENDD